MPKSTKARPAWRLVIEPIAGSDSLSVVAQARSAKHLAVVRSVVRDGGVAFQEIADASKFWTETVFT